MELVIDKSTAVIYSPPMLLYSKIKTNLSLIYYSSALSIKLIIIDQLVKWWLIGYLKQQPNWTLKITSFFDIVYSWNYGISFGLFRDYYQYSNAVFIGLNSIITAYLYSIILKCTSVTSFIGYSCIVGGAIGNLLDRCFKGAVFDFLYFHYHTYGFPIFNLADSFISIGVALVIYDYYKMKKSVEEKYKADYDALEIEAEQIRRLNDKDDLKVK